VRIDSEKKEIEYFVPGPESLVQEPAFVPRSPDAPEGDGFLITLVDSMGLHRNEVVRCPVLSIPYLSGLRLAYTLTDHSRHLTFRK